MRDNDYTIILEPATKYLYRAKYLCCRMVATLATPSNLTADPNGNLGSRPQDIDLVTSVLNPNQTVSSISDKIGDKVK